MAQQQKIVSLGCGVSGEYVLPIRSILDTGMFRSFLLFMILRCKPMGGWGPAPYLKCHQC